MIDVDIGRVVFVNANKYTIDIVSINGNHYKDIPFLSLYSKPNSSGQGIYMMPEIDSYTLVLKIKNEILGAERFALGFFNPMGEDGRYDGEREEINQGDFVAKTIFGNKVVGRTDGSITVKASDQSQFTMFPASGNKNDSWGYDNLLRAIFENVEINTDAGFIHQKVNKKEKSTNVNFEIRNKPLYSENPQIIRGNIGSQGLLGDSQYFHTLEVVDILNEGRDEVIRQSLKWKTNGFKEHIINDADGNVLKEVLVTETFDKNIKKYNPDGSENLIYQEDLTAEGTKTTTAYSGDAAESKKSEYIMRADGYFKKTIWNEPGQNDCYVYEVDELGNTKEIVKDANGNQVLSKIADNRGQIDLGLGNPQKIFIRLNGVNGQLNMSVDDDVQLGIGGDLTATVNGNTTITTSDAEVNADSATINADTIDLIGQTNLGGLNGKAIVRDGDTVQVEVMGGSSSGIHSGTVTASTTKVKST